MQNPQLWNIPTSVTFNRPGSPYQFNIVPFSLWKRFRVRKKEEAKEKERNREKERGGGKGGGDV